MKRNTRRAQSRAARTAADADAVSDVAARLHSAAIHLLRGLRREDDASGMSAARLSALSVLVFGGEILHDSFAVFALKLRKHADSRAEEARDRRNAMRDGWPQEHAS